MLPEHDFMNDVLQRLAAVDGSAAIQLLESTVQAHPQDPRPLLLLAGHCAQTKNFDRAEAIYISALQLDPSFAIARFQLGLLQFTSARPHAAMATWAPLEVLAEGHYLRLFAQAFWSLAQEHFEETCQLLRAGIAANSENQPLNRDMELLLQRVQQAGLPSTSSPSEDPPPPDPQLEGDPSGLNLFLLSNYRKQD